MFSIRSLNRKPLLFLVIVLCAIFPRYWLSLEILPLGLSVDELQSVVHANLPFSEMLASIRQFDPHPPLYYIQLHYWIQLGGASDAWMRANSIAWSVLAVLSIWVAGVQMFGRRAGTLWALLYALSPFSIATAQDVRMYSMMIFLAVWTVYFTWQFMGTRRPILPALGIFASMLAFVYTQGAGFVILPSGIAYGLWVWCSCSEKKIRRFIGWLAVLAFVFLASWAWFSDARDISVAHTLAPTFLDIAYTFAQLLFGTKSVLVDFKETLYAFSVLMMGLLLILMLSDRRSRALAVTYVIMPFLFTIAVSYLFRPIWLTRTVALVSPFLYLGIALVLSDLLRKAEPTGSQPRPVKSLIATRLLAIIIVLLSIGGFFYQQTHYLPWSNLRKAVELVQGNARPNETIIVSNGRVFWGWCWYYIAPGTVSPLRTDYTAVASNGTWIVSDRAIEKRLKPGQVYWVVYRDQDLHPADIFKTVGTIQRQLIGVFRNVRVEKVVITVE